MLYFGQPLYVQDNDSPAGSAQVFVCYIRPWTIFTEFDGNGAGGGAFNPPQTGSYGKEVEVAFTDARLLEFNTLPITITVNGGNTIQFSCVYNTSVGFAISCYNVTLGIPWNWRFADCNWIQEAFNVHGFGIYDPASGFMRPKYYQDSTLFYMAYLSDSIPNLTLGRYLTIFSEQLTRERRLPSFKNYSDTTGQGLDNYTNELATVPILLSSVGKYTINRIENNGTIISVRAGSETQFLHIYMIDNANRRLLCGNPFGNFLTDPDTPYDVIETALDSAQEYRSPRMMNFLLFGNNRTIANPIINTTIIRASQDTSSYGFFNFLGNDTSPWIRHSFQPWGPTNDTSAPWVVGNASTINKVNQVPTIMAVDFYFDVTAANCAAGSFFRFRLQWRDYNGNPITSVTLSDYQSTTTFDATAAGIGPIQWTETISASFLSQCPDSTSGLPISNHAGVYSLFLRAEMVTPLVGPNPAESVSFEYVPYTVPTPTAFTTTSPNTAAFTYVNPAFQYQYGNPATYCLCDDLIHQLNITI
jgi:hypothetical protein